MRPSRLDRMRKRALIGLLNPGPAPHFPVTLDIDVEDDSHVVIQAWGQRYAKALEHLLRGDTRPKQIILRDLDGCGAYMSPPGRRRIHAQVEYPPADGPSPVHRGIQEA